MQEVLELLVSPYEIRKISVDNITFGRDVKIEIELNGNGVDLKTLVFDGVSSINCNAEHYHIPGKGIISTLDISEKKWAGVKYRVDILEDALSFYCNTIEIR